MRDMIIKTNDWYDSLREPIKSLAFFIPTIGIIAVSCIYNSISGMVLWIALLLLWRIVGSKRGEGNV